MNYILQLHMWCPMNKIKIFYFWDPYIIKFNFGVDGSLKRKKNDCTNRLGYSSNNVNTIQLLLNCNSYKTVLRRGANINRSIFRKTPLSITLLQVVELPENDLYLTIRALTSIRILWELKNLMKMRISTNPIWFTCDFQDERLILELSV